RDCAAVAQRARTGQRDRLADAAAVGDDAGIIELARANERALVVERIAIGDGGGAAERPARTGVERDVLEIAEAVRAAAAVRQELQRVGARAAIDDAAE